MIRWRYDGACAPLHTSVSSAVILRGAIESIANLQVRHVKIDVGGWNIIPHGI